ncbi:MAG: hypothetical protein DWB42_06525 [Chloroflexi bacterium]|nr:hypothetical protein [Chloroflexota bacterium]MDL1884070.1 hypothetical protein [Anaerolineae bacterium CFX8]
MGMVMTSSPNAKKSSSGRSFLVLFILLLLFLAAAFLFISSRPAESPAATQDEVLSQPPAGEAAPPLVGAAGFQMPSEPLLAWVGSGAAPGKHSAQAPGQLALVAADGSATPLLDIPPQTSRLVPCGASSDGVLLAYYIGLDNGALYLMRGAQSPVKVDDVPALTCLGPGQAVFAGDRLAYIAYESGAAQSEFADGFLRVVNTSSLERLFRAENVTAFDLNADGAAYISLFTNNRNEADEAAVVWWNGSTEREVVTLVPTGEGCRFVSGQIIIAPDGRFVTVMGQRCKTGDTRTQWQLYVVDPAAGSATLAASDFQAGAFAPFAGTNTIFFSPDGSRAYFTVPDGVTAYTAGLKAINLADLSVSNVIEKQAVMPNFGGAPNAFPQLSPDARWLAMVVTTPNNENTLNIVDLANPGVAPITLSAGSRGDVLSAMVFTADSARLFAVAGGVDSADNSLFSVDLATGSSSRLSRGRFGNGLAVIGSVVAVPDWQIPDDPKEPAYLNMVVINADGGEKATWFTGADIVDGKVTNQRFAFPLAWRRP